MANGMYGFRKNGLDKVTLEGTDGDAGHLGKKVLQYCQRNFAMDMVFDRIELVDGYDRLTREQLAECIAAGYCDQTTGQNPDVMWFQALKNVRGDLDKLWVAALARGKAYMINLYICLPAGAFHHAYTINLDTNNLEFWIGFQDFPQQPGNRYTDKENEYHPHLIAEFPIKEIAAGGPLGIDDFIRQMRTAEKQYMKKEGDQNGI